MSIEVASHTAPHATVVRAVLASVWPVLTAFVAPLHVDHRLPYLSRKCSAEASMRGESPRRCVLADYPCRDVAGSLYWWWLVVSDPPTRPAAIPVRCPALTWSRATIDLGA